MSHITRWWWVASAPITLSGVYVGQSDATPAEVDSSIYELLATIIPPPRLAYCSPLARDAAPAKALYALKGGSGEVVSIDAFNEQHFGAWEGRAFAEVQQTLGDAQPTSHQDIAALKPEGGETYLEVMQRTQLAIDTIGYQITENAPNGPVDVLCVAPISVIRAAIASSLDLSAEQALKIHLQPLSLNVLEHHEHMGWLVHATGWTPWPMVR